MLAETVIERVRSVPQDVFVSQVAREFARITEELPGWESSSSAQWAQISCPNKQTVTVTSNGGEVKMTSSRQWDWVPVTSLKEVAEKVVETCFAS